MSSKELATPTLVSLNFKTSRRTGRPLRIRASFQEYVGKDFEFNLYVGFIENVVEKILPKDILEDFRFAESSVAIRKVFTNLSDQLPIIQWNLPEEIPGLLYVNILCNAEYTYGVGKFTCDALSRWALPGKPLPITCSPSLNFYFTDFPKVPFFIQQVILQVSSDSDLNMIKNRLPQMGREIRQTILAVKHARNVMALKHLSPAQKAEIIQENLELLLTHPTKDFETSLYEQMHQLLLKASSEEKIQEINQKMQSLIIQRPNLFTADIFQEIQHFVFLFSNQFSTLRDVRHITRLIAFHYLFRKSLKASESKGEREVVFKLLKTRLMLPTGPRAVLGIVIGMNLLKDSEMFDSRHTLKALQHCLPGVRLVKESTVVDQRSQDRIRLLYLEVEKEDFTPFTLDELKILRKLLPRELKVCIEKMAHPVFMPRNEEEIMRNILLLSQELKYIRDIPQVVISFDAQTEHHLTFTVILLRFISPTKETPLQEILNQSATDSPLHFTSFNIKQVGKIRQKYIKEANIFTAKIENKPFLRKDYSVDLVKARQTVSQELSKLLGDIRDFNGGILSKQHEVFHALKDCVYASLGSSKAKNDYLLENFFYSISPPLMQSILPPTLLKTLYLMLQEALEHDFKRDFSFLKTHWGPEYLLLMAAAPLDTFKEVIQTAVSHLKVPSSDLCFTSVKVYEISCLGYIYRCEDPKACALFYNTVQSCLLRWEKTTMSNHMAEESTF